MSNDVAQTSFSFFVVAVILTLFAAFSFFSPLALRTESPWEETASRALAHFLPVFPPLIVGVALRYSQVWAWYVGVFYMAAMFCLGVYLSRESLIYILYGNFVPPVFLVLSVLALPSLFLLFRGNMRVLKQLRNVVP